MGFSYTRHARERMRQRGISESEVEHAVRQADIEYADASGNPIYVAHIRGRRIKVVIAKDSTDPRIVITTGD
jgi:hypothetical protein